MPKVFVLALASIVICALGWLVYNYFSNYAQRTAKPLESALIKTGAVKKCSTGDNGHGWDNRSPWYEAVYEVPGNREEAVSKLVSVADKNGYHLAKEGGVEDSLFYADASSKQIAYPGLKGNVSLSADVYGSKTHNGEGGFLCGVTKNENPPKNKTTIRVTISLPEFYW